MLLYYLADCHLAEWCQQQDSKLNLKVFELSVLELSYLGTTIHKYLENKWSSGKVRENKWKQKCSGFTPQPRKNKNKNILKTYPCIHNVPLNHSADCHLEDCRLVESCGIVYCHLLKLFFWQDHWPSNSFSLYYSFEYLGKFQLHARQKQSKFACYSVMI